MKLLLVKLLKEPMVHFFLLAAALFGLNGLLSSGQKVEIRIDQQTVDFLVQQREDLELRVLSAAERQETIDAWIEDEVLYHEAYNRGLDRGDSRMRRNMILKMRGLLVGEPGEPTQADLKAYFEANQDKFVRPASIDLALAYFALADAVPTDVLQALNTGADPASLGGNAEGQPDALKAMTRRKLMGYFGPELARDILAIDDEQWQGPFQSDLFETRKGLHFVRIAQRTPAEPATYEQLAPYLTGDWLMSRSREIIQAEVERLLQNYEVVFETDEPQAL